MARAHISPLIKAQLEKLNSTGIDISSGHRSIYSSSPIIIPKKPPRSNASSSQSSSSYTSIADQMSSSVETSSQLQRESDNVSSHLLPTLSSPYQKLEHSAARDRIAVKNKRKLPANYRLSSLREIDDNQANLFSTEYDDDQDIFPLRIESKAQSQSVINLSDLDKAHDYFRKSSRIRDHSADNIIPSKSTVPSYGSSTQRAISFKRPQDIKQTTFFNRPVFTIKAHEEHEEEENKHESILQDTNANNSSSPQLITSSSSPEHIYDNSSIFTYHKTNITPDITLNEVDSSANNIVKTREHRTSATNRLRPVTMHITTNNDKQINEFENVFNQIKSQGLHRKVQHKEETVYASVPHQKLSSRPSSMFIEESPTMFSNENEPIASVVTSTNKTIETLQLPNRQKSSGGTSLSPNNKLTTDDHKMAPSWIDIAKQKQSKFSQSGFIEKNHQEEPEHQPISTIVPKKQSTTISSDIPETVKETSSDDTHSIRKPTYNPSFTRRPSPRMIQSTMHAMERDSIRALKANNPNRINNLIQLFDK
ncbi:unnamed protein product [Rotaria magnacalcarata]